MANGSYAYTGTIQIDTVTTAGTYDITGYGGQGGSGGGQPGGKGAEVGGSFVLQAGEKLAVIVAGAGADGFRRSGGGGGGASLVLGDVNSKGTLTPGQYSVLLVAAGGGGGANNGSPGAPGSSAFNAALGNESPGGAGFAGGSGGGASPSANGYSAGNRTQNQGPSQGRIYSGGQGGKDVANGSTGGAAGTYGGRGGFGGGGGGAYYGGGGGGGFDAGNGGGGDTDFLGGSVHNYASGQGGGSFDAGTAIAAVSGENAGNGRIVLAIASSPSIAAGAGGAGGSVGGGSRGAAGGAGGAMQGANGSTGATNFNYAVGGGGGGGGAAAMGGAGGYSGGAGGIAGTSTNLNGGIGGSGGSSSGGGGGGGYSNQEASFGTTALHGGYGGNGGSGGGAGGGGGGGGDGAILSGLNSGTTNTVAISGGDGGGGGDGSVGGDSGGGGIGVLLTGIGATATNSSMITGGNGGTAGTGNAGEGGLGGAGGAGLMASTATITNTSAGTIAGGAGGQGGSSTSQDGGNGGVGGAGISGSNLTISNAGTITAGAGGAGGTGSQGNGNAGAVGDAIEFTGGANSLTLNAGSTINGAIGLDTAPTTLAFAQSTSATLTSAVFGAGSVSKTGAGTLTLTNNSTYTGATTIAAGTLQLGNGGTNSTVSGTSSITDNGTLAFDTTDTETFVAPISGSGAVTQIGTGTQTLSGANTYSGGTTISAGTLDLATTATFNGSTLVSAAAGTGAITFAGTGTSMATLSIEVGAQPAAGGTFSNTLTNFGDNDALDLKGLAYSNATGNGAFYNAATRRLTVTENNESENYTLSNAGAPAYFVQNDGNGGTLITDVAVCYCGGTRIRVARDGADLDVAVEDLVVGDLAVTASGVRRPIRWLGHRTMNPRWHERPHEVMPVRISAHAFGENRPARDLRVSPGHSLCVDVVGEVLIPAMALINGTTITQEDVDQVTYWHVELEGGHDILLAENMPAESYLEMGNRGFFAEADVVALEASPDAPVVTHADFCRPFHPDGALVEVVRAQLAARAEKLGWQLESQGLGDLHLLVDGVRIEPRVRGLAARFTVPVGAEAVWLVSGSTVPAAINPGSSDHRALGLCVAAISLDDGFGAPSSIALDDPRLCVGFHPLECDGDAAWRWTAGRARLPASLWGSLEDDTFLRVDLAGSALPRWIAPACISKGSVALKSLVA